MKLSEHDFLIVLSLNKKYNFISKTSDSSLLGMRSMSGFGSSWKRQGRIRNCRGFVIQSQDVFSSRQIRGRFLEKNLK